MRDFACFLVVHLLQPLREDSICSCGTIDNTDHATTSTDIVDIPFFWCNSNNFSSQVLVLFSIWLRTGSNLIPQLLHLSQLVHFLVSYSTVECCISLPDSSTLLHIWHCLHQYFALPHTFSYLDFWIALSCFLHLPTLNSHHMIWRCAPYPTVLTSWLKQALNYEHEVLGYAAIGDLFLFLDLGFAFVDPPWRQPFASRLLFPRVLSALTFLDFWGHDYFPDYSLVPLMPGYIWSQLLSLEWVLDGPLSVRLLLCQPLHPLLPWRWWK